MAISLLGSSHSHYHVIMQVCVSPSFNIFGEDGLKFRIIIYPLDTKRSGSRDHGSFVAAGSIGKIVLKCDSDPVEVAERKSELLSHFKLSFRIFLKDKTNIRGPVRNDFAEENSCGLPKDDEAWDLLKFVHRGTLAVGVEV